MSLATLRRLRFSILFLAIASAANFHQDTHAIDLNGNSMSDIWEHTYGAFNILADGDSDGDGAPNKLESIAGSNPFDPASLPRITSIKRLGTNIAVSFPCSTGKLYSLQSSSIGGTNWITESTAAPVAGDGITLLAPESESARLFRIAFSDADSDADGLSDWEEAQIGTDPHVSSSSGQIDQHGTALSDYDYASSQLTLQNIVSIAAVDSVSVQPEPGMASPNKGEFVVARSGFPLGTIVVSLDLAALGLAAAVENTDFEPLPRWITLGPGVSSEKITLTPKANPTRFGAAVAGLRVLPGDRYRLGIGTNASVIIYPSDVPKGTGLTGQYFTNASSTYASTANFNPANLKLTRVDPAISFTWGNTTNPIPNNGYYCVRWTGQVQPQYSETYFFVARTDDGVKLWVNDQLIIDSWVTRSAADSTGQIALQAGVRYNIRMEYFQSTGSGSALLSWYSASQAKQTIPSSRLYPSSISPGPSSVTSPLTAVGFVGQPFSFTVTGANTPSAFTALQVPPGLTFSAATGLLTGVPLLPGMFQITLTSSNSAGLASSVLNLQVFDNGSALTREIWSDVPGNSVKDIPVDAPPTLTSSLGGLEGVTDFGDNYGERVRGYLTAPATGNYYFWLAGSDSAELWISVDDEPANKVRRATVTGPTLPRQWTVQPNQRSPWLALEAGQKYYVEVLHKAGVGTNDHWSVAFLLDTTGTNTIPGGLVPAHLLSRHFQLPLSQQLGTLYAATMLAQPGAISRGVGSASLRLSGDNSKAVLKFSYANLGSKLTGQHIHSDQYLSKPGQIIFDIDDAPLQPDGTRTWHIESVGTLSVAEIIEIIKEGKAYINLHTETYPAGEIKGYFNLASGTRTFTPPPPAPAWTDDHASSNAAARFLIQATFGPTPSDIQTVRALGYEGWISNQFSLPPTYHLPHVLENVSYDPTTPYPGTLTFNAWWKNSIMAPDQLRQRVAFALSEIFVVSEAGVLQNRATALSSYYDMLLTQAFGNFRELLEAVTLHPAMGNYLDMRANDKGDIITGRHPNENYAREVLQLFSIGLYRLWPDGTMILSSEESLVPTYDQEVIMGYSQVFTGWNYWQPLQANGRLPTSFSPSSNHTNAMVLVPTRHELGTKRLLDNVVLPQAWGLQASSSTTNYDAYCSQDLELAMDDIFRHPNVAPYICRQLIQRLVTSHPTRDYLYRVVQVFNDNGSGVRGDLKAVIKSILLDYEARSPLLVNQPTFGKQREPVLRVTAPARAFPAPSNLNGTYSQSGGRTITASTSNPHRMNTGDTVLLAFSDTSGNPAPSSTRYSVTVTSSTSFTINDAALASATYTQAPNVSISNALTGQFLTTNVIFVTLSSHGLSPGSPVFLHFTSGGPSNGVYQVISATNTSNFAVATSNSFASTGSCRIPKLSGGFSQSGTNITVSINGNHGLSVGEPVYIDWSAGASDGVYTVISNVSASKFVVGTTNSTSQTRNGLTVFPLTQPVVFRSGALEVAWSTWNIGSTDSSLSQTPLKSPTVFNFFFPDYKYPGPLAAAGLTTPEFQLTSDTEVAVQMNYLANGVLGNSSNTNGLSSFTSGDGDIVLDLGPWMTQSYTANSAAVSSLVDQLNTLLTGGLLSSGAKSVIVNYVANTSNFPYSSPPTYTQMRDRVRAVVHLILVSPDFSVQR